MFELVDKTKRIQNNFMVAIAFILRKHVDEIFLSLLHDAFLTLCTQDSGVLTFIYMGREVDSFPTPHPYEPRR